MNDIFVFLLFGAVGGAARSFIGVMKSKTKIETDKFLFNLVGSIIIGATVGVIVDHNPVTALSAGYAGIDIAESLLKMRSA